MLKQSLHWVKIGDGWVGRSKNGPKIGYPLWMPPYTDIIPIFQPFDPPLSAFQPIYALKITQNFLFITAPFDFA